MDTELSRCRGCLAPTLNGIHAHYISAYEEHMGTTSQPCQWDFFIAHAGPDRGIAEQVYDRLHPTAPTFLDSRSLKLGDDWDLELRQAQRSSLITVVLISDHTDQAYYQREEIAAAIALARSEGRHRVVPVYINSEAASSGVVPYGLRLKHGITLSDSVGLGELSDALLQLRLRLLEGDSAVSTLVRRSQNSDLSMSIGIQGPPLEPWRSSETTLEYRLNRTEDAIQIASTMPYIEIFKQGGPIEPIAYDYVPFTWDYPNLDFKLVNNGHRTVFLTEACFNIYTSRLDPSPLLVVVPDSYGSNARHFELLNEGWGTVQSLRVAFHLTPVGKESPSDTRYPNEIYVDDFDEAENIDVTPTLEEAGVDCAGLDSIHIVGQSWSAGESAVTFVDATGKERELPAEDFEQLRGGFLGDFQSNAARLTGELIYDAQTLDSGAKPHRVKFSTVVYIFDEHRAGAPAPPTYQYATKFKTEGVDYQRRIGISHVLKPGEADRFNVKLGMDKSSWHSFTVTLMYNDGQEITSPTIELHSFIPRSGARYANDRSRPLFR